MSRWGARVSAAAARHRRRGASGRRGGGASGRRGRSAGGRRGRAAGGRGASGVRGAALAARRARLGAALLRQPAQHARQAGQLAEAARRRRAPRRRLARRGRAGGRLRGRRALRRALARRRPRRRPGRGGRWRRRRMRRRRRRRRRRGRRRRLPALLRPAAALAARARAARPVQARAPARHDHAAAWAAALPRPARRRAGRRSRTVTKRVFSGPVRLTCAVDGVSTVRASRVGGGSAAVRQKGCVERAKLVLADGRTRATDPCRRLHPRARRRCLALPSQARPRVCADWCVARSCSGARAGPVHLASAALQ